MRLLETTYVVPKVSPCCIMFDSGLQKATMKPCRRPNPVPHLQDELRKTRSTGYNSSRPCYKERTRSSGSFDDNKRL